MAVYVYHFIRQLMHAICYVYILYGLRLCCRNHIANNHQSQFHGCVLIRICCAVYEIHDYSNNILAIMWHFVGENRSYFIISMFDRLVR